MKKQTITWFSKGFFDLSLRELYRILHLRQDVFVIEQTCIYQDLDFKDEEALHVFAQDQGGEILAYARLIPPGKKYAEASLGRVIVASRARAQGLGHELLERVLQESHRFYPGQGNRISAQAHLKAYYEAHGFLQVSQSYLEDGIPHIEMLRPGSQD